MLFGRFDQRVIAALSQVPEIKRQVRDVGRLIQRDAKSLAPVRTGRLRRSIRVQNVYDPARGLVTFHVGWDRATAWYGGMVESGTYRARSRPHLGPAADRYTRSR